MGRRARRQSKKSLLIILLIVIVVVSITGMQIVNLHAESESLAATELQLQEEISAAKATAESLETRSKYMQTKKYIEDEAKNKLGLVYPDEIVIRPSEE